MRKEYINPEMKVVKVETQQMLAASNSIKLGSVGSANSAESSSMDDDIDW